MMHVDTIVSSSMLNTVTTLMWDALSLVWMELLLFALAAGSYVLFAGLPVSQKVSNKNICDADATSTPPGSRPATPRRRDDDAQLAQRLRSKGQARDFAGLRADLAGCGRPQPVVVNAFLEACVQCGETAHAEAEFDRFAAAGLVDVVSCNTLLKAKLRAGRLAAAKDFLRQFPNGLQPNKVSYNEVLNALVQKDRPAMWLLLDEMQAAGYAPSPVTCSILLKSLTCSSSPHDIERVLGLVDAADSMDEVLFSSLIEACVRANRLSLLSAKLERYLAKGGLDKLSAPTYGSMIKAFGKAKDVERVWQLWDAMRAQGCRPTSVTTGCMVDALVKNAQPHEALELVEQLAADPETAPLLNTVVYSTLLKGFTLARQPDLVDAVYAQMQQRGVALNTISFNTMIDAFATAGRMDRCEALLADLERSGQPDVVTFATMVKGYCMSGDLDRGFSVLRKMLAAGTQKPDEILFNSLLDGCARQHRVDEALALVDDMHKHAVQPSNYTLSILVKLLGRARRLEDAFRTVDETCRRFNFRANVHVYTCLLQACVQNRQLARALELHDKLVKEARIVPDAKLYTSLARGCLTSGSARLGCVVRAAHGLPGSLAAPKVGPGLEPRILEEAMHALSAGTQAEQVAVPLLADLKALGVHVERGTYASAVQTSVKRAGCHPSKTFGTCVRGRSGRGR